MRVKNKTYYQIVEKQGNAIYILAHLGSIEKMLRDFKINWIKK
jgi:hypothetical protein